MNRGYLTLAQNGTHDYLKMAYVLAMSLKLSQGADTKISVIVNENEEIPSNYLQMFDKIIKVPIPNEEWKVQNKWIYFDATPYDETIVLDSDMLFFTNHSWWWDAFSLEDLAFTETVLNFRGEEVTSDYYRKVFTKNDLPNCYTGLFFFRKTKGVETYFKLVKLIFENWKEWYDRFLKEAPIHLSGDVVYAITSKIMFRNNTKDIFPFLKFIHMRNKLQDARLSGNWSKTLRVNLSNYNDNVTLKINNIIQSEPLHYIDKLFMKDEVVKFYEDKTLRLL